MVKNFICPKYKSKDASPNLSAHSVAIGTRITNFFKNNKKELIISLFSSIFFYLIITKFLPLQLVCPPEQKMQCLIYAWMLFFIVISILFVILFSIIKLVEFLKKKM